MGPDDIALANSLREGYAVLYFVKRYGRLRFEGLVECMSHTVPGGARRGQKISFRLGPVGGSLGATARPLDAGADSAGTAEGMPLSGRRLARLFPVKVAPESLGGMPGCPVRPGTASADDKTVRWPRGVQQSASNDTEDVEGWIETLDILADPDFVDQIRESEADLLAGRVVTWVKGRAQSTG